MECQNPEGKKTGHARKATTWMREKVSSKVRLKKKMKKRDINKGRGGRDNENSWGRQAENRLECAVSMTRRIQAAL